MLSRVMTNGVFALTLTAALLVESALAEVEQSKNHGAASVGLEALLQDPRFGEAVSDHIANNPELVLDALIKLERQAEEEERLADANLVSTYSATLFSKEEGPRLATFIDYNCSYCKSAEPIVEHVAGENADLELAIVQFPILGPTSNEAAKFALAVKALHGDDMYMKVHRALMTGQVSKPDFLEEVAERFLLDFPMLTDMMNGDVIAAKLLSNRRMAQDLKITGTPGFVSPNGIIRGMATEDQLVNLSGAN